MHFLLTWYEGADNPATFKKDTAQIYHAFIFGAWYMKRLVQKSQNKTPQEMHQDIAKLYKELTQLRFAAASLPLTREPNSPPQDIQVNAVPAAQATEQAPMMWTATMLREFEDLYQNALNQSQATFPFRDKTFRTVDALAIIRHLQGVFAPEQTPIQPQVIPPQAS